MPEAGHCGTARGIDVATTLGVDQVDALAGHCRGKGSAEAAMENSGHCAVFGARLAVGNRVHEASQ